MEFEKLKYDMNLFNGDCMDFIEQIPNGRLLLTDIPYEDCNNKSRQLRIIDKGDANTLTFDLDLWLEKIYEKFEVFVIFCGWGQFSKIVKFFLDKSNLVGGGIARPIIWSKTNPSPMNGEYGYLSAVELAVYFRKKGSGKFNAFCKSNVITCKSGSSKMHPTQKPQELFTELILDNTNEGDIVVDTCMGSGTTGICCKLLNRKFYGCELNEKYYNLSKKRIEQTFRQTTLF